MPAMPVSTITETTKAHSRVTARSAEASIPTELATLGRTTRPAFKMPSIVPEQQPPPVVVVPTVLWAVKTNPELG